MVALIGHMLGVVTFVSHEVAMAAIVPVVLVSVASGLFWMRRHVLQ
jgi:hypothetical protein